MSFEPWAWESENWGGDPEGQLAKALERARMQTPKPLKLTKLPHKDQTSLKDFEKIESEILSEIEKEGGALGMKNLTKIADETKIKTVLSKMEKDGKLFMHKDGDIYTHEPKGHMNFAESFEAQATHIDWETDGQEVDLPKTVEVPDDLDADEIADYLSDEHGFLVNTFQIKDAEEVRESEEKLNFVPEGMEEHAWWFYRNQIKEFLKGNLGKKDLIEIFKIDNNDLDAESFDAERARYTADWENSPYSSWDDAWSDDVNFPTVEKREKLWLKNLTTIGVLAGAIYIGRKIKGV